MALRQMKRVVFDSIYHSIELHNHCGVSQLVDMYQVMSNFDIADEAFYGSLSVLGSLLHYQRVLDAVCSEEYC